MARYPFTAEANKFIREIAPYTAEITLKDKSRKLKLIARKLDKLQEEGRIKTTNPRNFTVKDMITYVNSRRLEGISESTISKDVSLLNQFFISIGNHCVEEFRVRAGNVRPHAYTGKKDGIPDDIVEGSTSSQGRRTIGI